MTESINVCLACDDNYSKFAGVVIASILANANPKDRLNFYILDGGISEDNKQKIQSLKFIKDCEINFITIDESMFEEYKKVKTHKYVTLATYYRLKLPSLLPEISRVIYLDCDMVVTTSLSNLFNKELGEKPLAGVSDIKKKRVKANPTYVNAGMLVMDLDNMRRHNLEEKFLDWTRGHIDTIKTGDQEIINEVCRGNILVVEDEWNVQSSNFTNRSSYTNEPKIVHYTAQLKPWHFGSFSYHRNLYFKYLQMTPWKMSHSEYKHWTRDNQIVSILRYLAYRPLFWLRPAFYRAVWHTYLKRFFKLIFSISDYGNTHLILRIFGLKIKFPKREFVKLKRENPFYYYKENNIDITTIPPATGQIRDIQLANLVLLKELDYVCKQCNLQYWLDWGSLLGAVRHKGFVPWDDDIDVSMPRMDYEKIIDAFNTHTRNKNLYASLERAKTSDYRVLIKIRHKKCNILFVDIFPVDIYDLDFAGNDRYAKTAEIKNILNDFQKDFNDKMTPQNLYDEFAKLRKNLIIRDKYSNPGIIYGIDFAHSPKCWIHDYGVIFPLKEISFEGLSFSCINNPDEYLKILYKNYLDYPKKIGFGHSAYLTLSESDKEIINSMIGEIK